MSFKQKSDGPMETHEGQRTRLISIVLFVLFELILYVHQQSFSQVVFELVLS